MKNQNKFTQKHNVNRLICKQSKDLFRYPSTPPRLCRGFAQDEGSEKLSDPSIG